ncbi:MAG: hypothetical protein Q4D98_06530 [Planctomycetia bacterium]|nr:hypothetical protein [Planctomycetia bacterium]
MKRDILELKQKLMQRFLDNAIDQATYDRMLAEIDKMKTEDEALAEEPSTTSLPVPIAPPQPIQVVSLPTSVQAGQPAIVCTPEMIREVLQTPGIVPFAGAAVMPQTPAGSTGSLPDTPPSPVIDPILIRKLKPGQSLEIWWHYPVTPDCAQAWRATNAPLKLSLSMNMELDDDSMKYVGAVPNLRELNLTSTNITDDGMAALEALEQLDALTLVSTEIDGSSFRYLQNLKSLRELNLSSSAFSDEGMAMVGTFTKLEELRLDDTNVTDAGMEPLAGLAELKLLNLQGAMVSDIGLQYLAGLVGLMELYLGGTIPYQGKIYESPISDKGLSYLQNLVELRILHLNDTQVSDRGMPLLSKLNELRELNLADTYITDEALPVLSKLGHLRNLLVDNTEVTQNGVHKYFGPQGRDTVGGAKAGAWNKLGHFLRHPWGK